MRNETVDVKEWIDNQPRARFQVLILGLCFLIVLFDGFDVAVMGFIAPALMDAWGLSRTAFGPVMSAGMVGLAIGALFAGPYADRFGRKKVLLCAVTAFSLAHLFLLLGLPAFVAALAILVNGHATRRAVQPALVH